MANEIDFNTHPWEDIIFLDIETCAKVEELEEGTALYDSFMYKMRYAEEAQRKDFSAYNLKALFDQKAALYPEFGRVLCITVGMIQNGKIVLYTFYDMDEAVILRRFNTFLEDRLSKNANLALCGVNLKFFDLRFIYIRSIVNGVRPVKGHIDLSGLKPWLVRTLDITDIWKQTSPYNAPLVCMAECLGLPSPKSDMDGSEVNKVFWKEGEEGLQKIVKYCERDVFTTANIARKIRLESVLELATEEEVAKASSSEPKDETPVLMKLRLRDSLDEDIQQEIKNHFDGKKVYKKDKPKIERIILAHYLTIGDKKAVKTRKEKEVSKFVENL